LDVRCGPDNRFRIFYTVSREHWEVQILAIGVKDRDRLRIGKTEIAL
jgi:hypothetical protein